MTNKTEMVLVPRELLERLISATKVARGEGSPTQRAAEALLSAPAEDVRAVVDEPVAWQFFLDGKLWNGDDRIKDHRLNTIRVGYKVRDVYARPQRPVVSQFSEVSPQCSEHLRTQDVEPVAYVLPAQLESMKDVGWMHALKDKGRTGTEVALYLKPSFALVKPDLESAFEKWWQEDGQFCRSGGGSYEKTFAYRAYEACLDEFGRLNK